MRKILCVLMACMMLVAAMVGCSGKTNTADNAPAQGATGKIVINFEGTVVSVEDDTIVLDSGKTVTITSETSFSNAEGPVDSLTFEQGDYVQGYTEDDPNLSEISAHRIHLCDFGN